jgi:3'-phosphoadenosine 5'-phosphosulfate sulfotransferase (PAPS reductase)/FAD synthetase
MNIVCFSGGKDSTAMLLRMLELKIPVDKIVFADTYFEFPELYNYINMIEKYINRKIEFVYPNKTFEEWFEGLITRGDRKGEVRGFPLKVFPCYWSREAKIKPLQKIANKNDKMFIGIAFDELERCSKDDGNLYYPLVDWKWTEQDCINYLNKKGLFNPLYVNFDRLGCYFCPKQSEKSLYVLWKIYPDLWKKTKFWESKNLALGRGLIFNKSMSDYEKLFDKKYVPKKLPKYECWNGCESVKRAFLEKQSRLDDFKELKGGVEK